ncbi:MAG: class 1 fructose-bisphosphatase, partial [Pseudomonadota bacterium]
MGIGVTITEFILLDQKRKPQATGAFTSILSELTVAAKIISRKVSKSSLSDMLESGGEASEGGDTVQKLQEAANFTI